MRNKIFFLLLLLLPAHPLCAREEKLNMKEFLLEHLLDRYYWHITKVGDREIAIYMPIIVYSKERGWAVFSSRHLTEAPQYRGYYLAREGLHEGKVVERNAAGKEVRPLDISITKNVLALFLSNILLIFVILWVARWYRKDHDRAPRGFVGFMEMFIMSIQNDVIKPCVGKDYHKYSPYLLTAFFFIFFNNLVGHIPIFPFGANLTGNIAITMSLALCTFVAVNVFGNKEYWKGILWPDVPLFLKFPLPIMPVIEFFGIFTKPFALMVRLFANIFAGHSIVLALTALVFITAGMGRAINSSMIVVSILFSVFMLVLEILVAYIQAYVFTMLSAVFIGLSRQEHKPKKENVSLKK